MKKRHALWTAVFLTCLNFHAPATTLYVSLASTNPVPPYADWSTAATNIQDAVDASTNGDLILVTNVLAPYPYRNWAPYQTGGRVIRGSLMNRVAIDKPVTVESVNGPSVTIIEGSTGNPPVRCVYMTNGATLIGFTLTNGFAQDPSGVDQFAGGGIWAESTNAIVTNCVITGCLANNGAGVCSATLFNCRISKNSEATTGGGAYSSVLNNCMLTGNVASSGGGADNSMLNNCMLTGNIANSGGGAAISTLFNCTIASNSAPDVGGGGTLDCILTNCVVVDNSASALNAEGGGAFGGSLDHCTLVGNSAEDGGAAFGQPGDSLVLNNCFISNNVATSYAGGVSGPPYALLTNCILNNCTLAYNSAGQAGGGAVAATLNNCIISNNTAPYVGGVAECVATGCVFVGNSATQLGAQGGATGWPMFGYSHLTGCSLIGNAASSGGGAAYAYLTNCILVGNVATNSSSSKGSAAYNCILYNSTLCNNLAGTNDGGAVAASSVFNTIVYNNTGGNYPNSDSSSFKYCCTIPIPANGIANITNDPTFASLAIGDFHLSSNSPCINSGNNAYVTSAIDLDGNPRIVGGTVDIGAYEYQTPTSVISYAWLQQYGLPTDGSVDYADLDGTGFNVYQDWIAGLNPTNALSVLAMLPPVPTNNPSGLIVSWQSVSNRTYFLQSSTNLAVQPAFSIIQSNIVGQPDVTSFMDTNVVGSGPYFYRVGVQE